MKTEDAESIKNLCFEWLEIAASICIEKAFDKSSTTGVFWSWVMSIWSRQESTEIENLYESFYLQAPNNLTTSECSDLIKNVYKNFVGANFDRFLMDQPTHAYQDDSIWFSDFLFFANIVLIFSFIISGCIFTFKTEIAIEEAQEIAEDYIAFESEATETAGATETSALKTVGAIKAEEKLEDVTFEFDFGDLSNIDKIIPETIDLTVDPEKSKMLSTATISSLDQSTITSQENSMSALTSAKFTSKKMSKNFVNINIDKVKQKSGLGLGHTPRFCRSVDSVNTSRKRSAIPVRVGRLSILTTPQNEDNGEGIQGSSNC